MIFIFLCLEPAKILLPRYLCSSKPVNVRVGDKLHVNIPFQVSRVCRAPNGADTAAPADSLYLFAYKQLHRPQARTRSKVSG